MDYERSQMNILNDGIVVYYFLQKIFTSLSEFLKILWVHFSLNYLIEADKIMFDYSFISCSNIIIL
jgi:hypothetical protein